MKKTFLHIKKLGLFLLCLALAFALWACGDSNDKDQDENTQSTTNSTNSANENALQLKYTPWSTRASEFVGYMTLTDMGLKDISEADQVRFNLRLENYQVLCKVWGLVKYYHPNVALGQYDMDLELKGLLLDFADITTTQGRDQVLADWLRALGSYEIDGDAVNRTKVASEKTQRLSNLAWIDEMDLSDGLTDELHRILAAVPTEKMTHYYYDINPSTGTVSFKNEKEGPISTVDLSQDMFWKMDALFRYWNMNEYFNVYQGASSKDRDSQLLSYLQATLSAVTIEESVAALQMMTNLAIDSRADMVFGTVQESYKFWGPYYAPVTIQYAQGLPVVALTDADLGNQSGLQVGDIILKVDGIPVSTLQSDFAKLVAYSSKGSLERAFAERLLQTHQKTIKVDFLRLSSNGEIPMSVEVPTYLPQNLHIPSIYDKQDEPGFKNLADNIAYINPAALDGHGMLSLMKQVSGSKGLVIDMRCSPKNDVFMPLAMSLLPDGIDFALRIVPYEGIPGRFEYENTIEGGYQNPNYYKGKVAILIDETTEGHAEYSALLYSKAPRAILVGSPSAGSVGNLAKVELPGGLVTYIPSVGIVSELGSSIQGIGLQPKLLIKPTINGIRSGIDEQLAAALAWIQADQ